MEAVNRILADLALLGVGVAAFGLGLIWLTCKEVALKEFVGTGTLVLEGVTFYVKAKDLKEAQEKLACGHYDSYHADAAEVIEASAAWASVRENT
jgi:hypothetical protein